MQCTHLKRKPTGFTLIETIVATSIIGIGLTALMASIATGSRVQGVGKQTTQAVFLAQNIREWTLTLPFTDPDPEDAGNPPGIDPNDSPDYADDLDDLMDTTYGPPKDAMGYTIYDLTGWSQTITLTWRNPTNLESIVSDGSSDVVHVQVDIKQNGQDVLSTSWLIVRRD